MAELLEFVCEDCSALIEVNPEMRDVLLQEGCVVCGMPVDESEFR
ncbi:hypothetical protein VB773_14040 [Haloarculaceae archaeon H-GB2-1]|nr:hypothetical protein [Haloarculaceae archaeon H-GB1-1]MEA5387072.1 hypothetical protein [Haloarculaceae archaeon H-GB11]MEA5408577.1 hypothetical protein [Haloarculaceae archaeon H-GB2-1]